MLVVVIETLLAKVKRNASGQSETARRPMPQRREGRVMTHIFFHPDYTVGPGFSPGLLTLHGRRSRARP
jgi:hypothetical protein